MGREVQFLVIAAKCSEAVYCRSVGFVCTEFARYAVT